MAIRVLAAFPARQERSGLTLQKNIVGALEGLEESHTIAVISSKLDQDLGLLSENDRVNRMGLSRC
jgi:hypothetical protein